MSDIINTKNFRVLLDEVLQKIKSDSRTSRERSIVITKLQEAIMWLGMDLKALGEDNPYPNSYDKTNEIVDKTTDGLKL